MTEEDFKSLLESVPKSYPAFVDGIMGHALEFGTMEQISRFIIENPEATAGDISDLSGKLAGLI